jgi:hypothetical protein
MPAIRSRVLVAAQVEHDSAVTSAGLISAEFAPRAFGGVQVMIVHCVHCREPTDVPADSDLTEVKCSVCGVLDQRVLARAATVPFGDGIDGQENGEAAKCVPEEAQLSRICDGRLQRG